MPENLYTPSCIRTFSGRYINVTEIKPTDVFPIDISVGLSRICRFGGHTNRFYSVAEHSVWCVKKARELYPDDTPLHFRCLMHDAHEAYLGDLVTPLIDSIDGLYPGVKDAVTVTKRIVQSAINKRFAITNCPLTCEKVKEIDRLALEYEFQNKVLRWAGLNYAGDDVDASIWLDYFKQLVKTPVVIAP